jgi:hypothetical protein
MKKKFTAYIPKSSLDCAWSYMFKRKKDAEDQFPCDKVVKIKIEVVEVYERRNR